MTVLNANDAAPKTLYVCRKVKNGAAIVSWAKKQGYKDITPASDMHVTIAFSRKPVNWMDMGETWQSELKIAEGGPREVDEFAGGAKALLFKSSELTWRNRSMSEAGASWDHAEYQPHITISYSDAPENVEPYQGEIVLGPELFEEIKADLMDGLKSGIPMRMTKFLDKASIGTIRRTSDGYVTARAKAVRAGVQDYLASELGLVGDHRVRVYRPADEVFSKDSLAGFAHAPITIDHPKDMVDAANWRDLAVGEVGTNVLRDGEFLALDLILKDASAIKAFDGGKKELSAGYTAEIEFVDNHPDYDAVMKNIRINHLALVDKGRAGSEARIGDSAVNQWGVSPLTTEKGPVMEMKAVAIGDKAINVDAKDADTLIKLIADKDKKIGELEGSIVAKDAEIVAEKAKVLTDKQINAKAKELADAMAKREKVTSVLGDKAKDMTDAQVEGALAVIDAAPGGNDTVRKAMADAMNKAKGEDDPWEKINAKKKGAK